MRTATRSLAISLAAALLAATALPADAHGRGGGYRGGHAGHGYHSGWGWRGPVLGVGIGIGLGTVYGRYWDPYYAWPPVVVVEGTTAAPPAAAPAPAPAMPPAPEPVIYPRNGQTAEQTEIDRRECNRWATTQPAAMADASVFHRAVAACMEGRGYTVR